MAYGYKTTLQLDGIDYDLSVCTYSFEKHIDENGDVTSKAKGGILYVSLEDIPDNNILSWGIGHRTFKSGKIVVTQQDRESVLTDEEISFEGAACINLKMCYDRDSNIYFSTYLTISAEDIKIGRSSNWINKEWIK